MLTLSAVAQERADRMRQDDLERLARQALHFTTERDTISPGWIVRNPKVPGRVELVNDHGECSCRRFQLWSICKHAAIVAYRHGEV